MSISSIKALFMDIGGVLLSNGWDHQLREKTANFFNLDYEEMSKRHALTFDTFEIGKISLNLYLERVVFYEPRSFSKEEFKHFMFSQAKPYQNMIDLVGQLKKDFKLKVIAVTNEGRELMEDRIHRFKMKEFIDYFVCSAFVHLRKPDEDIFRLALDFAQVNPKEVIYIDDRKMLVEIGTQMGMQGIHHINYENTKRELMDLVK